MSTDADHVRRDHRRRYQRQTLFLIVVGLIFACGLWYSVDEMLTESPTPRPDERPRSTDTLPTVFELLGESAPKAEPEVWRKRIENISVAIDSLPKTDARVAELRQRLDVVSELLEKHAAGMRRGSVNESPAGELLIRIEYEVGQLRERTLGETAGGVSPEASAPKLAVSAEVRRLQAKVEEAQFRYDLQRNRIPSEQWEELSVNDRLRIEKLALQAEDSRDPQTSIAAYEEASGLLQAAVADLRRQQLEQTLRTQPPDQALDHLRKLRGHDAPEQHLVAIDSILRNWEPEAWLGLAQQQMEAAAPDDPGFAEMHLVLAGTRQLIGDSAGSNLELKRAWDAVERMAGVERAVETSIDLIESRIESTAASELRSRIRQTAELCGQVTGPVRRAEYYADLAGLAQQLGDAAQFSSLLELANRSTKDRNRLGRYLGFVNHARALSRTGTAREILSISAQIPQRYDPFPTDVICCAYAAMTAARRGDQTQFLTASLLAEVHLASADSSVSSAIPVARFFVAMADVEQGDWRRAVVSARNLRDPRMQSRILFRVLARSPDHVRQAPISQLIREQGDIRGAASAAAEAVQHGLVGDAPAKALAWIDELPLPSLRAAGYAGMARAVHVGWPEQAGQEERPAALRPDPGDSRLLMLAAEHTAAQIDDPIQRACAWLWMAATRHLLGDSIEFQAACDQCRAASNDAWQEVWRQRPGSAATRGVDYYVGQPLYLSRGSVREQRAENLAVSEICLCLTRLAELQARCDSPIEAYQSCLDAARATQAITGDMQRRTHVFLRLQAVAAHTQMNIGVHDWIPEVASKDIYFTHGKHWYPCLVAAWSEDAAGLRQSLDGMQGEYPDNSSATRLARANGELALLAARAGNTDEYRQFRRTTLSLIERQRASDDTRLLLAEADAWAGEFVLAQNNLISESLVWFGDSDRPRSALAVQLARSGRWNDAWVHAAEIRDAWWKLPAVHAVAQARGAGGEESAEVTLDWIEQQDDPLTRVAGLCGLAAAAAGAPAPSTAPRI